ESPRPELESVNKYLVAAAPLVLVAVGANRGDGRADSRRSAQGRIVDSHDLLDAGFFVAGADVDRQVERRLDPGPVEHRKRPEIVQAVSGPDVIRRARHVTVRGRR